MTDSANLKTQITVDLNVVKGFLVGRAEQENSGISKISFFLCHEGTNSNGAHFTRKELNQNHETAIGTKINLKHSQSITDIVGGITSSVFLKKETKLE